MLILALSLGFLLSAVQWIPSLLYYKKSIRSGKSYQQKAEIGKVGIRELFLGIFRPDYRALVNGVFYPEICASVGLGIFFAFFSTSRHQWIALSVFSTLAAGRWLFKILNPVMLRIPARWMYFVGLTLSFMAVDGFSRSGHQPLVLCLQGMFLVLVHSQLWPMTPFVQMRESPSRAMLSDLSLFLYKNLDGMRIAGLPFPLTTGQLIHAKSLGYNGGSQLKAMAEFRLDRNPNGSGDHAGNYLFEPDLVWYGVEYKFSYLDLSKSTFWKKTPVRNLFQNTDHIFYAPSFRQLEARYGRF